MKNTSIAKKLVEKKKRKRGNPFKRGVTIRLRGTTRR